MFTQAATEAAKKAELDANLERITGILGFTVIVFAGLVILDVIHELWKHFKRPRDWR